MADRFIPQRSAFDLECAHFKLTKKDENANPNMSDSPAKREYRRTLAATLFGTELEPSSRILALKHKAPVPNTNPADNAMKVLYSSHGAAGYGSCSPLSSKNKPTRHIPQQPEKILDAPDLVDDYYLNLLDWNKDNILAIALRQTVYLWNASTGDIQQLMALPAESGPDNIITSLAWIQEGSYLAIGTNDADVHLWDTERVRMVRCMKGHSARVSSLSWNSHILSSGSRDSLIFNHDVRQARHIVSTLEGHQQEVCGLKWSPDGTQLASGGNDNQLLIWDLAAASSGQVAPKFTIGSHMAAVKALAWCPWQPQLLASGGGTADRTIKFWNTATGACLNSVDTKSQVCAIMFSTHYRELVSSHGFSQNQLTVWKYPSMVRVAELTGHQSRVLHLAMSPDGHTVCSAAGDETLRFWKVFDASEKKTVKMGAAVAVSKRVGLSECGSRPIASLSEMRLR